MKSEQEIRGRIEEYKAMQKKVADGDISAAEERYATRVVELEWVLENE